MEEPMPMDQLAKLYIKIRTKLSVLEAEHEAKIKDIKAQQEVLVFAMKDQMLATGSKSVRTEFGTVSLNIKTRYQAQDWEAMHEFIVANNAPHLLEKRISQGAMAEFLEAQPDNTPIGLVSSQEYQISVRKPSV